ncbi:MAG: hypothetical protein JEZ06_18195 [Anaerolineaceae bacterium]|nr:hypothetical protein [Anaerolineaceae bacterium]
MGINYASQSEQWSQLSRGYLKWKYARLSLAAQFTINPLRQPSYCENLESVCCPISA